MPPPFSCESIPKRLTKIVSYWKCPEDRVIEMNGVIYVHPDDVWKMLSASGAYEQAFEVLSKALYYRIENNHWT